MASLSMATKQLLPNQHVPLHFLYGIQGCCLCHSQADVQQLEIDLLWLLFLYNNAKITSSHVEQPETLKRLKEIEQRIGFGGS